MNFNLYDEEQKKIFDKAMNSAREFCDNVNQLNPKYREKLAQTLLGFEGFKRFIEFMRNVK